MTTAVHKVNLQISVKCVGGKSLPPADELVTFWAKLYQGQGNSV